MDEKVLARMRSIIREQLDVDEDQIKAEASFTEDLGADSLDLVELVMAMEEAFGFEIPDEAAEQIKTVQDALNYVENNANA